MVLYNKCREIHLAARRESVDFSRMVQPIPCLSPLLLSCYSNLNDPTIMAMTQQRSLGPLKICSILMYVYMDVMDLCVYIGYGKKGKSNYRETPSYAKNRLDNHQITLPEIISIRSDERPTNNCRLPKSRALNN